MIYLFSQDMEYCIPFDFATIKIYENSICIVGCSTCLVTYRTKEDCMKAMEYFKKKLDLGCRTFTFPSQEKLDIL